MITYREILELIGSSPYTGRIENSPKDPLGKIVVNLAMQEEALNLEIVLIRNFENWVDNTVLIQFFIDLESYEAREMDYNKLNLQLPIGFFGLHPRDSMPYFKYSFWVDKNEIHKVLSAIEVVEIQMNSVFDAT